MSAKEKAIELVDKMEKDFQYFASREIAIKHALIAVDECIQFENKIVQEVETLAKQAKREFRCEGLFWDEVKKEIQKI
jgi:thymidine kinase